MYYIKKIYEKYHKYGLDIVLIHPYEFEFERDTGNIKKSLRKHNINYPVIIDKNRELINKLGVNFWPTDILISGNRAIYSHIGEGGYKSLETTIKNQLNCNTNLLFSEEPKDSKIPPVYAGYFKNSKIEGLNQKPKIFGVIYTSGNWKQEREFIRTHKKSKNSILIMTKGKSVNIVAGLENKGSTKINIKVNGRPLKTVKISGYDIYNIANFKNSKSRLVEINTSIDNFKIYSFTFK